LAIRQPIANGENFIDFLKEFCEIYCRLFNAESDSEIADEYYKFTNAVIKQVDGTAFLKEFYEIALLCYVNKFGVANLLEAAYWIFRYSYSRRLTTSKTVREDSIPAFIYSNKNFLFDIILSSFNHKQLIGKLEQFSYQINPDNTNGNQVKVRFAKRVADYFSFTDQIKDIMKFDNLLVIAIKTR
jgi:hypothetical protein